MMTEFGDKPFSRLVGDSLPAQILDHFILSDEFDYSPADLDRIFDGAIPAHLVRILEYLVKDGILSKTARGYKLNKESPRALALRQYMLATIDDNLDRAHAEFLKDPVGHWLKAFPKFFEKVAKAHRVDVITVPKKGRKIILYDIVGNEIDSISSDSVTIDQMMVAVKQIRGQKP